MLLSLTSRQIGTLGENIAIRYLTRQNYSILARNWTSRWAEIDIIAQHQSTLVFVEVKTRQGRNLGKPEDLYHLRKHQAFLRAIQRYLASTSHEFESYRVDLITITLHPGDKYDLKHYPNIDI